ncbi:hypothetical protein AWN76_011790 [Rhodothermaceae bacterium RA]|nr:hypothetical protein AWN76_011790 [Rhodothermaceae bacterium RA]
MRWLLPNRLFSFLLALLALIGPVRAQTLVVDPAGPVASVREALAQAEPGARILVRPGIYREGALVIDRSVELVGEAGAVLDGDGTHQILTITADSVTVRGFTFRSVATSFVEDRAAVKVDEAWHVRIEGNRFEDTFFGIYLSRAAYVTVADNVLRGTRATESQSGNGIHLWYSRDVTITGNDVRGHRDGIYLEFVEDSVVEDNHSEGNHRYGLHFMFSDRCAYRRNVFRANDAGVAVMYTAHVEMTDNRFEHNWGPAAFGLLLKDITDSRVARNVFERNTIGLYAEGSNRVDVIDNDFLANGWAVKIMADAEANRFVRNNFIANSFDVATNSRQHYSTFDGNYWDQYEGYDLDRDGVGDVPFRPVRLFTLLVERNEPALLLMRSFFVHLLDAAERVLPVLTPEALVDTHPVMHRLVR